MNATQVISLAVLVGSVPVGHLAGKLKTGRAREEKEDLQSEPGDALTALVALATAAQGFAPALLARICLTSPLMIAITCAAAVVSNCFPYWLMFRPTGRGITVGLGALFALNPAAGACSLAVWTAAYALFRKLPAACIAAAFSVPVCLRVFGAPAEYPVVGHRGLRLCYFPEHSRYLEGGKRLANFTDFTFCVRADLQSGP